MSFGKGGQVATHDLVETSAKVLLLNGQNGTHLKVKSSLNVL